MRPGHSTADHRSYLRVEGLGRSLELMGLGLIGLKGGFRVLGFRFRV